MHEITKTLMNNLIHLDPSLFTPNRGAGLCPLSSSLFWLEFRLLWFEFWLWFEFLLLLWLWLLLWLFCTCSCVYLLSLCCCEYCELFEFDCECEFEFDCFFTLSLLVDTDTGGKNFTSITSMEISKGSASTPMKQEKIKNKRRKWENVKI